jgi:hypothetical protein
MVYHRRLILVVNMYRKTEGWVLKRETDRHFKTFAENPNGFGDPLSTYFRRDNEKMRKEVGKKWRHRIL